MIRLRDGLVYRWIILACLALAGSLALAGCGSSDSASLGGVVSDSAVSDSLASRGATEPLVIAFGDSLYAGYRLAPQEALPVQLQSALAARGVSVGVYNAGVSGATSAEGAARLSFVLDNAAQKPAVVVVGLGGNDMLRGINPAETRANLGAVLAELKRREISIVLTGMIAAPNMGADYGVAFNSIYRDLATQYDAALYPFILGSVFGNSELMLGDHIHPNAKGVAIIAEDLAPLVAEALTHSATHSAKKASARPLNDLK